MARHGRRWLGVLVVLALLERFGTCCLAGHVDWQFNFLDSPNQGFNVGGPLGTERRQAMQTAGNLLSTFIQTSGSFNATISVDVTSSNANTGYLAAAGALVPDSPNAFGKNTVQLAIQDNITFGTQGIVSIDWHLGYEWGYSSVVGSQYDFVAVALHELVHGLGLDGAISSTGTSLFGANQYSVFDKYVQGWNGSTYVDVINRDGGGNPTGPVSGAAGMLIDAAHPLHFNGPNAVAANGGTPVELYTPASFNPGSSIYHPNFANDLMYWSVGRGLKPHVLSPLVLGMLADLGYAVVVPEPGSLLLLAIGAPGCWLAVRWRRVSRPRRRRGRD